MKNIKVILLMAFVTATVFSAIVFTSCTKKVTCNNVTCHNGGTCHDGKCTCPTGYLGVFCETPATTYISYQNNTFTPVLITVNGIGQTIPVGGSVVFSGLFGTTAAGTATTSGGASSLGISAGGGIIGLPINWNINNNFPTKDTLRQPLDVGTTYFFLKMINKNSQDIIDYYVNVNFTYGQTYEDITVPKGGNTYDLGYYLAYPASNVQTQSVGSKITWVAVKLPNTTNQSATVTIN